MDTTSDMSRLSMVGADIGQRTSGKRKGASDEVLGLRILQDNTRAVASW